MQEQPIDQITEIAEVSVGYEGITPVSETEAIYYFDTGINAENFTEDIEQNKPSFRATIQNALDITTNRRSRVVGVRITMISFGA